MELVNETVTSEIGNGNSWERRNLCVEYGAILADGGRGIGGGGGGGRGQADDCHHVNAGLFLAHRLLNLQFK